MPAPTGGHDTPHQAARRLAELGYRVLPIIPGKKHPGLTDWVNHATSDTATIDAWYGGLYANHGVGIATGHDGLFVVDVDISDTKHGDKTLEDLEDQHEWLPATVTARTGSGGRHILLRAPAGVEIRNSAGNRLGAGLDVRGVGGQIVVAPTVHPCGEPYEWLSAPWDTKVADAPAWLIDLLTRDDPPMRDGGSSPGPSSGLGFVSRDDATSPGTWFNDHTTWAEMLEGDGWTRDQRNGRDGEQRWVRPGKNLRDGISATVGHGGGQGLHVFTSSVPELDADGNYTRFGYYAATRHQGDHSAAARAIRRDRMPRDYVGTWGPATASVVSAVSAAAEQDGVDEVVPKLTCGLATWMIDWPVFWRAEDEQTWLVEPLLAEGRGHALFAKAKSGKSLLLLEVCAALATGRSVLGQPAGRPRRVLYLDMEMTPQDVRERLEAMGYGPDDDLSNLYYVSLPSIPPLNTPAGAQWVIEAVDMLGIEAVIIDTTSRVIVGEENSADTFRDLFQHLGLPLKSRGVTYVRLDHAGKTAEQGQRGSSAKNDDVDIVWEYTRMEGGALLRATHRRLGWVPERVDLTISDTPWLTHRLAVELAVPAGTAACMADLDRLEVPRDWGRKKAAPALRAAGCEYSNVVISAAIKARKRALMVSDSVSEKVSPRPRTPSSGTPCGDTFSQNDETAGQRVSWDVGDTLGHPDSVGVPDWVFPVGDTQGTYHLPDPSNDGSEAPDEIDGGLFG